MKTSKHERMSALLSVLSDVPLAAAQVSSQKFDRCGAPTFARIPLLDSQYRHVGRYVWCRQRACLPIVYMALTYPTLPPKHNLGLEAENKTNLKWSILLPAFNIESSD